MFTELEDPIKIMVILLLIGVSGIYLKNINHHLTRLLENNVIARNSFLFIAIVTLYTLFYPKISNQTLLLNSVLTYIFFILLNKTSAQLNLLLIIGLFGVYLYNFNLKRKNNYVDNPQFNKGIINSIKSKNDKKMLYAGFGILALILTGSFLYEQKKISQYGPHFKLQKFMWH